MKVNDIIKGMIIGVGAAVIYNKWVKRLVEEDV